MFSMHPCLGQSAGLLTSMAQQPGHGSGLRTDLRSECTLRSSSESVCVCVGGISVVRRAAQGVGTLKCTLIPVFISHELVRYI